MKDYAFLVFIVLIKALVSSTKDFPPSVSCNMELSTWQESAKKCSNRGGKMFPFATGLDQLHLKHEIDVWTADYLIISDYYSHDLAKYCGFNYLNSTLYENNETFYGDCEANRNYFCINKAGNLVVYNNSREKIDCSYEISLTDMQSMNSAIKPGSYWNTGVLYGTGKMCTKLINFLQI
ncbi:uncharacterized protein LOC132735956, partial [Ruditapes philippinarum]|uniref:uncharacterized protein LOC132735956 n=1 Tax=Ruditapes philippinarum TaxID=129788 RepID=UPI00295B5365